MPSQKTEHSFRVISIESLETLENRVREVAADHGLSLISEDSTTQAAPFCGYNYFSQEMTLSDSRSEVDAIAQIEKCIAAIEELTEETVADGYVELI